MVIPANSATMAGIKNRMIRAAVARVFLIMAFFFDLRFQKYDHYPTNMQFGVGALG